MIQEAYVSLEVATLLKDKGFDIPCSSYYEYFSSTITMYQGYVPEFKDSNSNYNGSGDKYIFSRPTQQMACAWLREVHGIHITPIPCTTPQHTIVWQQNIINLNPIREGGMFLQLEPHRKDYNSYEEAVEAALKYCLENFI